MQKTNNRESEQGNNDGRKLNKNESLNNAGADVVDYGRSEQKAAEESKDKEQNPAIKQTPREEE